MDLTSPQTGDRQDLLRALRESEERHRLVVDHINDAVLLVDLQGRVTFANRRVQELTGYAVGELLGRPVASLLTPEGVKGLQERFRTIVHEGDRPFFYETEIVRKDGTTIWVEVNSTSVLHDGKVIARLAAARDITERRRVEEDRRKSETSFQLLFASNPLAMWVYDVATLDFMEVNAAAIAHYGYSRDEFLRMRVTDIHPAEEVARLQAAIDKSSAARAEGVSRHRTTWRHRLKDGRLREVDIASHRLTFAGRKAALVVATDVTELKRAEAALTRYAERLSVLHEIDRAIIAAEAPGAIAEATLWRLCGLLGVPRAIVHVFDLAAGEAELLAAVGPRRSRIGPGVRYSLRLAGDLDALRRGEPQVIDLTSLPPGPDVEPLLAADVRVYMVVPMLARGELIGSMSFGIPTAEFPPDQLSIAQEVAAQLAIAVEQARLRERVTAAEREYRGIFENAVEGLFRSTPEGRYLLVNEAIARIYGFASPDEMTTAVTNIGHDLYVDPAERDATLRQLDQHGVVSGIECRVRRKDGVVIWVSHSARAIRDDTGRLLYYEGNVMDITERKRGEAVLRQNEKLAAMSSMVAGVAHELNNPLAIVLGQAQLMKTHVGADAGLAARTDKLVQAAERCARVVRNFLALARQQPPELRAVEVNRVVTDVLELLAYSLRVDDVMVDLDLAGDLPPIWANADQLSQVVINLVSNAAHAMRSVPTARRLVIRTQCRGAPDRVVLMIGDSGPGIPPDILPRVFEPFFTTKPTGQGTGLGLPLCQGFIEAHGGSISVANGPGGGAVFTVTLPVTDVTAACEAPVVSAAGPLHILVIDDEPDVGQTLADMLRLDGHRVDVVDSGRAGLVAVETGEFDIIFTDLRMPEVDGPAVYQATIQRRPQLEGRFVFMTGDALGYETRRFLEQTNAATVDKPFSLDAIRAAVRLASV